jgi:hypothetical protein
VSDVPEADALEQASPVGAEEAEGTEPAPDPEAPEADAVEQAQIVEGDDEERRR